jgi:ABC-type transport system involved in multi-copper enzyme maturation permease subunit
MILHIVKKEILRAFLSLRFPVTLILVTAVMISGTLLFIEDYKQQLSDYSRNVYNNLQRLSELADDAGWQAIYRALSWNAQSLYRTPTRLAFLAEGHERELPNTFEVSPFRIMGPTKKLRGNCLLQKFDSLDWAFIVSVIMSFAAIVLVYDSISGERENGTLRLSMSNPVPRSTVILGKYLGILIVLMIPLLFGMLSSVIILSISEEITIVGMDWIRIAAMTPLSMLYLSIFVMLGLFVSSLFRSSSASLVVLLLVWVVIVIVIPNVGGTIVTGLSELPGEDFIDQYSWTKLSNAFYAYNERHPNASKWHQKGWAYGQDLARALEAWDALMQVYDSYWDRMLTQVQSGYNVARISPYVAYQRIVEAVAGSGIDHCESFLQQVRQYKHTLRLFLLDHYPLDIYRPHGVGRSGTEAMEKDPELVKALKSRLFTSADIPKFQDDPRPIEDSVTSSLWNIAILFAFNAVFFMAAYVCFLCRDIK